MHDDPLAPARGCINGVTLLIIAAVAFVIGVLAGVGL